MAAGLLVEEGAEVLRVDQVPVDADGQAKGRVDVEGLRLGAVGGESAWLPPNGS